MQYDEDLSAITTGVNLNVAPCYKCTANRNGARQTPLVFKKDDFPWADKAVLELVRP